MMEMVSFCIKLIGSLCILISGAGYGFRCGDKIEKRYIELIDFHRAFQIMYSDISYGSTSFVEVLQHVKEQSMEIHGRIFACLEDEIRRKSRGQLSQLWNETIEAHLPELHLSQADVLELKRVGQNIGTVDKEQQLVMLQLYLKHLELTVSKIEGEKDKQIKLCRMLGTMGSIFVVVILL